MKLNEAQQIRYTFQYLFRVVCEISGEIILTSSKKRLPELAAATRVICDMTRKGDVPRHETMGLARGILEISDQVIEDKHGEQPSTFRKEHSVVGIAKDLWIAGGGTHRSFPVTRRIYYRRQKR